MPFRRFSALAFVLLFALLPMAAEAAPLPFPDMDWSWYRYREAVQFLKDRGVIEGYPDGTFRPDDTINRAELVKIVFKGRGTATPVQLPCFSDVDPESWYAPYVCAAARRGIVGGYPDGTFRPDQPVNAAEAIKIVLRAYGREIVEPPGEEWYEPYVEELHSQEILDRSSYLPWKPLIRERAADLIWRMLRHEEEQFLPNLSTGCGKAPPDAPSSLTVDGRERWFLLTVPEGYVAHDPLPLIVAFHGRTNDNGQVRKYMKLDRNFTQAIIAYPAGIRAQNGSFTWSDAGDNGDRLRDIRLFDELVELLASRYCIDMTKIYTVGHSLGGWFADSVACVRGDVVRATATVGGSSGRGRCGGPVASMIIHHPNDNLASFSSAEKTRELRVQENGCLWDTVDTGPTSLRCVRHTSCWDGDDILWCPHMQDTDWQGEYYPHTWPDETAQHIRKFFETLSSSL